MFARLRGAHLGKIVGQGQVNAADLMIEVFLSSHSRVFDCAKAILNKQFHVYVECVKFPFQHLRMGVFRHVLVVLCDTPPLLPQCDYTPSMVMARGGLTFS